MVYILEVIQFTYFSAVFLMPLDFQWDEKVQQKTHQSYFSINYLVLNPTVLSISVIPPVPHLQTIGFGYPTTWVLHHSAGISIVKISQL